MSRFLRPAISCASLLVTLALVGCGGGSGGDVVAKVGGAQITRASLEHWTTVGVARDRAALRTLAPELGISGSERKATLSFLVASTRVEQEARELGLEASRREVEAELQLFHAEQTSGTAVPGSDAVNRLLSLPAETHNDQMQLLQTKLLLEKIERHDVRAALASITDAEVSAYYRAHKAQFILPETRDVAVVQAFKKSKADLARREIEAGKSLRKVVELRNDEPDVGGMKRGLSRASLLHSYEINYFKAKPHVLVGPLQFEIYYLFEVTGVKPPRQQSLAEVSQQIRRMLASQRNLVRNLQRARDARWRADTRCLPGDVVPECGGRLG